MMAQFFGDELKNEKMIEIVESRRVITRNLVKAVNASEKKPFLWINGQCRRKTG